MSKNLRDNSSLRCPAVSRWKGDLLGCGSANLSEEDDEGLFDCLDCGLFFTRKAAMSGPLHCITCGSTTLAWTERVRRLSCIKCGNHFDLSEKPEITSSL